MASKNCGAARRLRNSTSFISLGMLGAAAFSSAAGAQQGASAQEAAVQEPPVQEAAVQEASAQSAAVSVEEIVVTGSRAIRDGYEAPTPVTVLGVEEIRRATPLHLADMVNQLPALAGSARMNSSTISAGLVGVDSLNLRNLGVSRTLVLMDGQRMPASTTGGNVDVNTIPEALVERVDIVTGGASAAWGSDAVAGVVNYVLNKSFTGLKGEASGGVTTYGDDRNYKLSLSGGTRFAGDRAHAMFSIETSYSQGTNGIGARPWYVGAKQLNNPAYTATNGQPRLLARTNVGYTTVAPGAIVTAGPLRGLYFGEKGQPLQLTFGSIVSDPFMVGGDWKATDFGNGPQQIDPPSVRQGAFARVSYDITTEIQVYAQFSYSRSRIDMITTPQFNFGGLTIKSDNPFLPASVAAQMSALKLTSLNVGSWNQAIGGIPYQTNRDLYRYVVGASGMFTAADTEWSWDVFFDRNVSEFYQHLYIPITANYNRALDAVTGPNGQAMCRSTLTNPTDGCSPLNILGTGVASQAGLAYVNGNAVLDAFIHQSVFSSTVRGEPFSTWAGPASVAFGIDHRRETEGGTSDALSKVNSYWAGNYKPILGSYNVTEGFFEVVAPLAQNTAWADSLDFNGAVRGTGYSTSGYVTTWKVGSTYTPIPDIKFRITRSRDIRAGNLSDMFQSGQTLTSTVADPFRNNQSYALFYTAIGNTDLKPEKGDTLDLGVVLQPRFWPGFTASVDHWKIKLRDAIATLSPGVILTQCYNGDTSVCGFIQRDAVSGLVVNVIQKPINLAEQTVAGLDMEASYRLDLGEVSLGLAGSQLTLRALATHYTDNTSFSGIFGATPIKSLGAHNGTPFWRYLASGTYTDGSFTGSLTARGLSDGLLSASYLECASNCPTNTGGLTTIDNNHVDGYVYFDMALNYKFRPEFEAFLSISNVANKQPAVVPNATGIGSQQFGVSQTYYDVIGRTFRAGVRFAL